MSALPQTIEMLRTPCLDEPVTPLSAPVDRVPLLRRKALLLAFLMGLLEFWGTRSVIFSDGISYLEIARRYADGEWSAAVNAYWSPFYSWVLAVARLLTGKSDRWELVSLHLVNLLAWVAALVLFEKLLPAVWRLRSRESSGNQYRCYRLCGYCLFLWASLHMIGIGYCSPDMLVLALNLAAGILLIRIHQEARGYAVFAQLGVVLAVSYLCKAAMLPVALVYGAVALASVRRSPHLARKALALAVPMVLLCAPWIIALHHHQGVWTFGESGKLNYAWEVDGAARSTHWQGEPGNIGTPLHPTRRIFSHPDVYEFGTPIDATYAPWFDPTYWYAGVKPGVHAGAQAHVLLICLRYVAVLLCLLPGCVAAVALAVIGRRGSELIDSLRRFWFLMVPVVATILMYCLVYVDKRYVAGPMLVIGLTVLSISIPLLRTQMQLDFTKIAALLMALFVGAEITAVTVTQIGMPPSIASARQQSFIAREAREMGLRPGDRIAYIGCGISSYWALLDGLRITAEVPASFTRDGTLSNYVTEDQRNPEDFWGADASVREDVLNRLRALGIRAVVAGVVPDGADTRGWTELRSVEYNGRTFEHLYLRMLQ